MNYSRCFKNVLSLTIITVILFSLSGFAFADENTSTGTLDTAIKESVLEQTLKEAFNKEAKNECVIEFEYDDGGDADENLDF
jgi:hypothetical protein